MALPLTSRVLLLTRWLSVAAPVAVLFAGCADPPRNADAGTGAPTLCAILDEVFTPRCAACHSEPGGITPFLTADVVALVVGGVGADGVSVLVAPGDPEGSLLFRKIAGTQSALEGERMPSGGALDDAQIAQIGAWIEDGAPLSCATPPSDAGPDPVDAGCQPDCAGRACGDDGCGGVCGDDDGACPDGLFCNTFTGVCADACAPITCVQAGAECDEPTPADDGCGAPLACGSCEAPETCGGDGVPNVCGCTPRSCAQAGVQCGDADDGCGGTLDCGDCPGGVCNADQTCAYPAVSLSSDLMPMFEVSCAANGCHGGAAPRQGLDLRSASSAYATLVEVTATVQGCTSMQRVDPGSPSSSVLVNKLVGGAQICGGNQMPGGMIPDWTEDQIDIVRAWIGNGAPDN